LKKFLGLLLTLSMLISNTYVFAEELDAGTASVTSEGESSAVVSLSAEAPDFNVTLPLSLMVYVDAEGEVTTADNCKIVNYSAGPIQVKNATVRGIRGWKLVDFTDDLSAERINTLKFGFKLMSSESTDDGMPFSQADYPVLTGADNESTDDEMTLIYDATIPGTKTAITDATQFAEVIFTVDWYVEEPNP